MDIAFSSDSRRFYDLRGPMCNIWEPDVLIRLSNTDERGSETASEASSTTLASMTSKSHVDMPSPVLALATSDRTFYCAGNDDGVVHLFDRERGEKLEFWHSANQMAVEHLEWSPDATNIVYTEVGGKITVKRVLPAESPTKTSKWDISSVFDVKVQVESVAHSRGCQCTLSTHPLAHIQLDKGRILGATGATEAIQLDKSFPLSRTPSAVQG